MKLHRFYVHEMHNRFGPIAMGESVWIHDKDLLNQWLRVLRFRASDELILFNDEEERLYKITTIEQDAVHLSLVTELERNLPEAKIYLFWSLLKKDKNDWVLQKATELGVHKFIPLLADRSEKTGFNLERATKIVIEAAEQCGRSDIPLLAEPVETETALAEYGHNLELFVCEQGGQRYKSLETQKAGVLIGPEGGWSDSEKGLFEQAGIKHISISKFTLRAETAAIVATAKMLF